MNYSYVSKKSGFGLVELLVAMSLSAVVVTSLLLFQTKLLKKTYDLWWHSVAWLRVSSLAETLIATQGLSAASVVSHWQQENMTLLPHANGSGYCATGVCHLSLAWGKSNKYHITQTIQVL